MDKHEPESEPVFTPDRLEALLQDSKIVLQKNKNYPEEFRAPLQTFKPVISSVMLEEINSSCKSAISSNDLDKFVKQFYTSYVSQAQSYFELGAQLANLFENSLWRDCGRGTVIESAPKDAGPLCESTYFFCSTKNNFKTQSRKQKEKVQRS